MTPFQGQGNWVFERTGNLPDVTQQLSSRARRLTWSFSEDLRPPLPRLSPRHRDISHISCQDVISVGWNQIYPSQDLGQWWVPGDPLKPVWLDYQITFAFGASVWWCGDPESSPSILPTTRYSDLKKKTKPEYSWAEHFRICQTLGGFRISPWIFQSFLLEKTKTVVKRVDARDHWSGATFQLACMILVKCLSQSEAQFPLSVKWILIKHAIGCLYMLVA